MMAESDVKKSLGGVGAPTLPNRQAGQRQRLKVTRDPKNPKRFYLEVTLGTANEADAFWKHWGKGKRGFSAKIFSVMKGDANTPPKKRRRDGYLQPSVPKLLRTRLEEKGGRRGGAKLLRDYFVRGIDRDTGELRKDNHSKKRTPRDSADFVATARKLLKRAKEWHKGDGLVRYTFNARKLKRGIEELARHLDMTISEVITAAMDRVCNADPAGGHSRRR